MFNGDIFEYDPIFKRLRNLLHDMFLQGNQMKGCDILYGAKLVISVTATEDKQIFFRFFRTNLKQSYLDNRSFLGNNKDADKNLLEEVGPIMNCALRRNEIGDELKWKCAMKRFKPKAKKHVISFRINKKGKKR